MKKDLVIITLTLCPSCYRGDNYWECTINGENRMVTCNKVQFCAEDFIGISGRFNIDECADVEIKWTNTNYYIDSNGIKQYFKKLV